MQLFYFTGTGNPPFDLVNNSLAARAGLLLADTAVIDDSSMFLADVDHVFGNRKQATKITFATRWMDVHHPDQAAELRNFARLAKASRVKKRKEKADLIILKQFDIYVDESYNQYTDFLKNRGSECGLYQLQPLVKERFLLFYSYSSDSPECADGVLTPVSELMQMMGDKEDRLPESKVEDVAWVLPMEFLSPVLMPPGAGPIAAALPEGALPQADEEAIWIEPLLQLSNINIFDADEIQAVRQDLRAPGAAFRTAIDEWMADCYHPNRRTVRERARFFEEVIRPAAVPLQEAFWENKIVVAHQQAQGKEPVCLMLYAVELPLRALWELYEKQGCIPAESGQKLRAVWETAGRRRFPMFIISPVGLYASDKDAAAAEAAPLADALHLLPPASARKSIDL